MVLSVPNEAYKECAACNIVLRKDFGRSVDENFCLCAFGFYPLMRARVANIVKLSTTKHLSSPVAGKSRQGTHL